MRWYVDALSHNESLPGLIWRLQAEKHLTQAWGLCHKAAKRNKE